MISGFASEHAKQRFHELYDSLLDWPVPATDVTVPTSFGPTYLRRSGNADGPPIVLLPGMSATSLSWQPFVAELSKDHVVYALDPLGEAGRSEQTAPMQDAQAVARWLAEVLDGLGHDSVHLIGLSRGGWLALNQAIHSPERLASVTAVDPGGFGGGWRLQRYMWTGLFLMVAPKIIRRRVKPDFNYQPFVDETIRRLVMTQLSTFRVRAFLLGRFTEQELGAITVPTTVLLAEDSAILDSAETQRLLRRVNPAVDVEILPGTAHNLAVVTAALARR